VIRYWSLGKKKLMYIFEARKNEAMKGNFHFWDWKTCCGVLIIDFAIPDAPRISPLPRRSVPAERPVSFANN